PSCARAQGVFAQQSSAGTRFIITDRAGHVLCGVPLPNPVTVRQDNMPVAAAIVPDNGLILAISGPSGDTSARAFFPRAFLEKIGRPSTR
ncbi:hypothetical protein AB2C73_33900, partial [Pseudomonas aeruginosa]